MTRDDKEIVSAFRVALTERIGKDRFELWFGDGVEFELVGQTLHVAVADQFVLDRLRERLRRDLNAACLQLLGKRARVEFRLDDSLSARRPASDSGDGDGTAIVKFPSASAKTRRGNHRPATRRLATLEEFVVGDGSRIALTGARTAVERPGKVSPVFLYGPTGTGKTHLLEGIATAARKARRVRRVVLLSAEQFTTLFLQALQGSGLPSFRRKYRDVQLLLIDDVQFFCGKRATIVELQHTVDSLLREGRQVVLAADRSPGELKGFGAEFAARISGGLICAVEPPEEETRFGIARHLARRIGFEVPDEVLRWIALRMPGDARRLAGALHRLHATSRALARPVDLELAASALADVVPAGPRVVRLPDIENAVCDVFGIDSKSLHSNRRSTMLSQPRMLAMWLARKYTRAAYSEIGDYFGRRSHSTVISAQHKVEDWMTRGAEIHLGHGRCTVDDAVRRLEARLRTG